MQRQASRSELAAWDEEPAPEGGAGPLGLARRHATVRPTGGRFLGPADLDALVAVFARARERLEELGHEDAPARVAAEWLYDNDYVLQRVFRQLAEDLPPGFQQRLPRLVGNGRPRVLAVAEALYPDEGPELDVGALEAWLREYQSTTTLTIAELWALPGLLRLVMLERCQVALARALGEPAGGVAPVDPGRAAGRLVRSLRLLAEIDWKDLFCRHSAVERRLGEDPARAYLAMDFETRDAYRQAVEELAFLSKRSELEVATVVLEAARAGPPDGRRDHVGEWLLGPGRRAVEHTLGVSGRSLERTLIDHPHAALFGLLLLGQLACVLPVLAFGAWAHLGWPVTLGLLALAWLPSTIPAETLAHGLLSKLLRPRLLPKLDFSKGIPSRWRTLVVVPTLLGKTEELDRLLELLETHYLSNPDPELRFALLTDHLDAKEPVSGDAEGRLAHVEAGVRALNVRYGDHGPGPFHLLHRAPKWNPAEGAWMGWERKRGKLEELNRLLRGATDTSYVLHVGDDEGLADVAFILTLDSDSQLSPGEAARLVGALAHPLNRPRPGANGRVHTGYTVIQPRVEISATSAGRSLFSRLSSGDIGLDIYSSSVSETYQDLFAEGIYAGKGLYDVDAFRQSLDGRVPENALVSHDLFEGLHGRVALASDVVVYEEYPPHYLGWLLRMHRWVRGDWQLVPWLFPSVPSAQGRVRSSLTLLDRFKIADNLRRSLLAPALVALAVGGWLLVPAWAWLLTLAAALAPGSAAVWSLVTRRALPRRELSRWFLAISFAPVEAFTALDAVVRATTRMAWTHQQLLEWTTASQAERLHAGGSVWMYARRLWTGPAVAALVAAALAVLAPASLPWATPFLVLWAMSPELARRLSLPVPKVKEPLTHGDVVTLREVTRRTWLFYESFVGPADHWLPPDHFQEHPLGALAHRTSPTNIGMLLLSELAAHDLGYLGPAQLASWVGNTLENVERLERHRGHLFNWYDTQTLLPLEPRYVSTVDSGNLAGALLALAVGLERVAAEPPARPALRLGLLDTARLLEAAVSAWADGQRAGPCAAARQRAQELVALLDGAAGFDRALVKQARADSAGVEARLLEGLRSGASPHHDPALLRDLRVCFDRLGEQLTEAEWLFDALVPKALEGEPLTLETIAGHAERVGQARPEARAALERAGAEASTLVARFGELARRARTLAHAMDFRFLYDAERRLFHVGFNLTVDRLDPHHYDLLASEARLTSFLAVVWRQVPVRHWFELGRPLTATARGGRALLSWGGSMFEYLMPPLLMKSHEDTLLFESCEAAIDRQIAWGRQNGIPWGVSESGYAFLDGRKQYQYRAFGVPGLGLRRGLEEDLVIAPYASLLAVARRPRTVARNVDALRALGMMGLYGLYEAADFHPRRAPGGRPARVQSYMAHHHGMSLVALTNTLCGEVMIERFHADPQVRAGALLLDERLPAGATVERPLEEPTGSTDVALTPPPALPGWEPDPSVQDVWALGNDRLSSFVTADGGGGLRWRELMLTRWEPDPVTDGGGVYVYVQDVETDELFGVTAAPLGKPPQNATARFEAGVVEFSARHQDLVLKLRITVASRDDVELRELEITNLGVRPRSVRVIGCLEPVLETEAQAGRHPAFSKLFLRCSPVPELAGALVSRVPREEAPAPVLLFRILGDAASQPRLLDVDRAAFLGRRGSFRVPGSLDGLRPRPDERPQAPQTLDPLLSVSAELELPQGSRQAVTLLTAVAQTRAEVLDLGRRFASPLAVRWTFEDSERSAARRAQRIGVPLGLLPSAQRLLTAALCPQPALRAPEALLRSAQPAQHKLWGRGISGDEPLVVVRHHGAESDDFLRELVAVHRALRSVGVAVDVVLVDERVSGYGEQGAEGIARVLGNEGVGNLLHQRGGFHVVPADQAKGPEVDELCAAARVLLDAREGPLHEQLLRRTSAGVELPRLEPVGPPPGAPADPPVRVAVPKLELDNGYGGFDGTDYVVKPGVIPPAPWCNVLANERFGCLVSEGGLGSSWSLNASENRLTPWRNDPVGDAPAEVLYLRDEETARVWSTTPLPCGQPTLVRHRPGSTRYELACAGLEQAMTVFVPPGESLKVVRLTVKNASERPRRLTATYYAEWVLGTRRASTRAFVVPFASAADSCLGAQTWWSMDFAGRAAFLASSHPLHGFTCDRAEFLGQGGELARPAALERVGLSGHAAPGHDPCAALQVHLELGPKEETEVSFFLGQAESREAALELARRFREPGAVERAWAQGQRFWESKLGAVRVKTPDAALDRLCNGWLMCQSLAARFFGRAAFYQSSGAFGFRDQLQDSMAFLHFDAALTRHHLLEAAAHQFSQGDVLHWWHPPGGAGVRTRCSDDLLWLVYATAEYVTATGDAGVLQEPVPFLEGDPLATTEGSRYGRFATEAPGTLLEHCRRALVRGLTQGPHGLPLIGDGDWNDGMNRVGLHGKGESVWLAWFACACLERFAGLLRRVGDTAEAERWLERREALSAAISQSAWDGNWWLRAFHDDGSAMGSAHSAPPHIDSIAQSWAVLSGAGEPERNIQALAAAERLLVQPDERLVLLLAPPFGPQGPEAGYIAAYPPGVRENGGQYTHAAAWLGWAHAVAGDGRAAHRIFSLLNPLERTKTREGADHYMVEPWVLAADIYARPPWVGRGGWTWYSGAAAWTWRLAIEGLLGLRRKEGALEIDPCLPPEWDGFEAWVKEGERTVHVVVHNQDGAGKGVMGVVVDGVPKEQARVELKGAGTSEVEVWLGQ